MKKIMGFTLMEVMITVVIISILATIAFPSYQNYITRSRRGTAQGDLQGLANAMERFYTISGTYVGTNVSGTNAPIATLFPAQSPIDGNDKYYNLFITNPTVTTYNLQAVPIGGQIGDGLLELTNTGRRGWDLNNDGDTQDAGENKWTK